MKADLLSKQLKKVDSIRYVREMALALREDMAVLGGHAQSLSQTVGVISEIADQIRRLTIIAAIEDAWGTDGRPDSPQFACKVAADRAGDCGITFAITSGSRTAASNMLDQSLEQVNTVAGETARAMEEVVQAVTALAEQANSLALLIDKIKA